MATKFSAAQANQLKFLATANFDEYIITCNQCLKEIRPKTYSDCVKFMSKHKGHQHTAVVFRRV